MSNDIELVPVRRDARGNVREWRVDRSQDAIEPAHSVFPAEQVVQAMQPAGNGAMQSSVSGSHVDRAKGFVLETSMLGLITGLAVVCVGVLLGANPWSWFGLALIFVPFCLTWVAAYALHTFASAEGVSLLTAYWRYRIARTEQKELHRRYREETGHE